MVQKIVDIARVCFNWVEPRPFRLAREFQALAPSEFETSHRRVGSAYREQVRRTRYEDFSTPAMRGSPQIIHKRNKERVLVIREETIVEMA